MDDLNQLTNMTAGKGTWIGLNDLNRKSMDLYPNSWRWSTQNRSQTGYMNFRPGSSNKTYHYINKMLSWESAKNYCRTHHTDLAMIENEVENQQVLSTATNTYAWIGLYRVPWMWSDGTNCYFIPWWSYEPDNLGGSQLCGVVYKGGFSDLQCNALRPFICSVRKQTRIKIKIQTDLDLTDQTIMDNILLLQLSASLASAGNTDFNLSWSAPPQKLEPAGDDNNE
ncbi:putative C-type lectin domain family 20 member A [Merluccius polli]|uniref:C-type lectin domain family 20 member A n=1 Tax=Merluccius polli TaxID=89951 RepID=A0AA47MFI4_MERPO|nr:putative C-type lectin domain family 20 member A [Merluccius polli]